MNSKERFNLTCNFIKTDKPPVDYLAHCNIDKKLKGYFGVQSEEEFLDRLRCDFYYLPGRDISQNEGLMRFYKGKKLDVTDKEGTCTLGIRWHRGAFDSKFSVDEAIAGPLQNAES
ncbi:MAG TPA: hypothetical protein GXX36_12930 [Clostridiaceae bacterium]|nr:hypothetical protein [Clostridiaceae bacterium]